LQQNRDIEAAGASGKEIEIMAALCYTTGMVATRLTSLTQTRRDLLFLFVTVARSIAGTMPQHQALTPHWWIMLAMNLAALPIGWVMIHHMAPALGNAMGTGLAILLFVAVPAAMLMLMVWRVTMSVIVEWVSWVRLSTDVQLEPEGIAIYSVANLFSPAKVPYKLYSLACSLLE
jgi:hypothetical protein